MKKEEVPQDHLPSYGKERRALYALDPEGRYTVATSDGWDAEAVVNGLAIEEYERLAAEALQAVHAGSASALAFHMYQQRMEPESLAQATGLWLWRVRRHLRPEIFKRLPDALLQRHADALGLKSIDALRQVPDQAT